MHCSKHTLLEAGPRYERKDLGPWFEEHLNHTPVVIHKSPHIIMYFKSERSEFKEMKNKKFCVRHSLEKEMRGTQISPLVHRQCRLTNYVPEIKVTLRPFKPRTFIPSLVISIFTL
ncbi:hypothetical protein D3C87_1173550 [compost metagenome]